MSLWQMREILIPGDHPSAEGHFPGQPIVPGALLLDAVLAAIADVPKDVTIRNAKFLRPVRHGTPLQLRWQEEGSAFFRFECLSADGVVLAGTLATGATP
jgi:3-hydroxyacyl-[acyl-carrier-protein] dehydratase